MTDDHGAWKEPIERVTDERRRVGRAAAALAHLIGRVHLHEDARPGIPAGELVHHRQPVHRLVDLHLIGAGDLLVVRLERRVRGIAIFTLDASGLRHASRFE